MNSNTRLIFVYNADSSLTAQTRDFVHKIISPKTYPCRLCGITYNNLGTMKNDWKKFVENLPHQAVFLHKDELEGEYAPLKTKPLPAIFKQEGSKFTDLIPAHELNQQSSIQNLKNLLLKKLNL